MTEHVDFELQETLRTEDGGCARTPASCCPRGAASSPTRRCRSTPSSTPRRPRSSPSGGSTSSATRAQAREHVRASAQGLPGPVQGRRDARPGRSASSPTSRRLHAAFAADPAALRLRPGAQRPARQPDLADRPAAHDGARLAPGADGRRGGRDRRARPTRCTPASPSSSATSTRSAEAGHRSRRQRRRP